MTLEEFKKRLENLGFKVTRIMERRGGALWVDLNSLNTGEYLGGFGVYSSKELLAGFYNQLFHLLVLKKLPSEFWEAVIEFLEKRKKNKCPEPRS